MPSQVFYRKFRPKTLAEVAGQDSITRTLINALITDRVSHAYLFFGPRGTGKTSTGRILAKAVNCLKNETGEPCNNCAVCISFNEGRAVDLIEIDAASNTGVEDIRNLKEKVNFAPNVAKYKVYIIDEVHMLSNSAFNALLKTLEEPPGHVIFILATTEVHKVPATIISRCQRFDFRRIPQQAIVARLDHICHEEGIEADQQALALIARNAAGSLRDAENLLEQMVVYHGLKIDLDQARAELGLTGDARVKQLLRMILARETRNGLMLINGLANDGVDLRQFNREFIEYLRQVLLVKAGAEEASGLGFDEIAEVKDIVAAASLEEITRAVKLFGQVDFRPGAATTLPLELALVEYSIGVAAIEKARPAQSAVPPVRAATPAQSAVPKPAATAPAAGQVPKAATPSQTTPPVQPPAAPPDINYIRSHWNDFVNSYRMENARNFFRQQCVPIALENNTLTMGFYHEIHKSRIENPQNGKMVQMKLKEAFGVTYQLRCIIIAKDDRPAIPSARDSAVVKEALSRGARIVDEEQ